MKIIHQQWQLVGTVQLLGDDDELLVLGKDQQGNDSKTGTIVINVARFRGNEVDSAYQQARTACDELLAKFRLQGAQPDLLEESILDQLEVDSKPDYL